MQSPKRHIRIDVQYDGTNYVGWQRQKNGPSVQERIEEALHSLTGERITLRGAGRTDSGVHALGQVAAFSTHSSIPTDRFHLALNTELPPDIIVDRAREVPEQWDPRRLAKERHYRYTLDTGKTPLVTCLRFAVHFPRPLNVERMRSAARLFEGRHDFRAFRSSDCGAEHAVRTILLSRVEQEERFLYYRIHGHAFLRNMVRIIVGTLLEVGMEKRSVPEVEKALHSGNREDAGPTAPAKGLCLMRVVYPDDPPSRTERKTDPGA